jgi:hypothetical protein
VKKFKNSDIDGGFSFHAEAGSGLPRTRAGKQQRIEFMLSNGLITPQQAMKKLDVADTKGILSALQSAEDMALRENEKLMKGEPLNQIAVQNAMQQIQQFMADPNADLNGDGVPDAPEEKIAQAQQMLEMAKVAPFPFEDYQTHLTTHKTFMESVEYERLPVEIQQEFEEHYSQTLQTMMSIPQIPEPKPVQTTLQLKGTVGPTVAAEILNKGGVLDATPEQMAEEPLETWVTDSMDKPDTDEAGNDPLTQAEQILSMTAAQDKHEASQMQTAHDTALTHAKAQQGLRHAEEAHQEKLRQMRKPAPAASK